MGNILTNTKSMMLFRKISVRSSILSSTDLC